MRLLLKTEEVNFIVYRYLVENGFCHTAFSFLNEGNLRSNAVSPLISQVLNSDTQNRVQSSNVYLPPHCLLTLLQKALLYLWLEYHTDETSGGIVSCEVPFQLFKRHNCAMPFESGESNVSDEMVGSSVGGDVEWERPRSESRSRASRQRRGGPLARRMSPKGRGSSRTPVTQGEDTAMPLQHVDGLPPQFLRTDQGFFDGFQPPPAE